MWKGPPFSTPSPAFIICSCCNESHSHWNKVIPHCSSDLHFPDDEWCWAFFHVPVGHLQAFSEKNVYLGLLPFSWLGCFVFLILSCVSCLHILEIKSLSVISFANIFFYPVGCLFILFMVSFAEQKLVCLIKSHLFIFISIALGDWPKETLVQFMYGMFCIWAPVGVSWCHVTCLTL